MTRSLRTSELPGRLIVFEGADETGKTTVSKRLAFALNGRRQKSLWLAFPGHKPNTLGAEIYALHHDQRFAAAPALSIQLLHVAAHIEAIKQQILPALKAGTWVVLDRYWWSTLAYGLASKVDPTALRLALDIEQLQWGKIRPALAFLFVRDLPGLKIQPSDRCRLQELYDQIARREKRQHPVEVIRNNQTLDDATTKVIASTFKLLPSRR